MLRQILVTTLSAFLVVSGAAVASDIYKWVDADGNVHYGDKPVGNPAERVAIESRRTDRAAVAAQVSAAREARAEAREARAAAEGEQPTAEELAAAAAEKEQECAGYREKLQAMLTSRRLYREGEGGEREYLSDDEIDAARAKATTQVEEYCG